MTEADHALVTLLGQLKTRAYQFVTPTPATHARVMNRTPDREARDVRDALGWSLPFDPAILDSEVIATLRAADALVFMGEGRVKSRYRVSSIGSDLLLHSAYPTDTEDAVFFGPDSYRFADLIRAELALCPSRNQAHLVDIGTGSGVGAIAAARLCPELRVTMTDINAQALRLARINAAAAGVAAQAVHCAGLDGIEGPIDLVVANPPYIIDPAGRHYRDGGDMHGARVSYDMAITALDRLSPSGRFILYTGSAIIDGHDPLRAALFDLAQQRSCTIRYRELDPDMFGEELEGPAYREVERIAIIGAVISCPD